MPFLGCSRGRQQGSTGHQGRRAIENFLHSSYASLSWNALAPHGMTPYYEEKRQFVTELLQLIRLRGDYPNERSLRIGQLP
jgi:hypothetical protein